MNGLDDGDQLGGLEGTVEGLLEGRSEFDLLDGTAVGVGDGAEEGLVVALDVDDIVGERDASEDGARAGLKDGFRLG